MHWKFIRKYAFDYFILNAKKEFGVFLLFFLSALICGTVIFMYGNTWYSRDRLEEILGDDISGYGMMFPEENENLSLLLDALGDEVTLGWSDYILVNNDNSSVLSYVGDEYRYGKWISCRTASLSMVKMQEKMCGTLFSLPEMKENQWYAVLGNGWQASGMKQGDRFTLTMGSGQPLEIEVAGVLKDDFEWVELPNGMDNVSGITRKSLNQTVLLVNNSKEVSGTVLINAGKDGWDSCMEKITKYYKGRGEGISINGLDNLINGQEMDIADTREYLKKLTILLVVVSLLSLTSTQTVITLQMKRSFGIWYANGASERDIRGIVGLNVLVMWIMTTVVSVCIGKAAINRFSSPESLEQMQQVINTYSIPYTMLILLGIAIMGIIVPFAMIRKIQPSELIREN